MDQSSPNRLAEARATFNLDGPAGQPTVRHAADAKVYRAKVFKSGNSLALRLPKALGLVEGLEMELRILANGTYSLRRADAAKRSIDGSKFIGRCPDLAELPRYDFEDSPRDWDLLDRIRRPA